MRLAHILACFAVFFVIVISAQENAEQYQDLTAEQVLIAPVSKEALEFGADDIVHRLIKEKKVPVRHYEIDEILYAGRLIDEGAGSTYKFKVVIKIGAIEIIAEYVVYRNIQTEFILKSSSYEIKQKEGDKKEEDKKEEGKKEEDKKEEGKKEDGKKEDHKKEDGKKEDYKKEDGKKEDGKKEDHKKEIRVEVKGGNNYDGNRK